MVSFDFPNSACLWDLSAPLEHIKDISTWTHVLTCAVWPQKLLPWWFKNAVAFLLGCVMKAKPPSLTGHYRESSPWAKQVYSHLSYTTSRTRQQEVNQNTELLLCDEHIVLKKANRCYVSYWWDIWKEMTVSALKKWGRLNLDS